MSGTDTGEGLRIELGGGPRPKDGFINVDHDHRFAAIRHNLDVRPWPFQDGTVEAVYSSHCLEHVNDTDASLHEMARICKVGAQIEVWVPDSLSDGAMVSGHECTITEVQIRNLCEAFVKTSWPGKRRLRLDRVARRPDPTWFPRARQINTYKEWTDEMIMQFVPRTCHEVGFFFTVVENEYASQGH